MLQQALKRSSTKHTLVFFRDLETARTAAREQARSSKTSKNIEIFATEDHKGGI
jgi:hypothetical protein